MATSPYGRKVQALRVEHGRGQLAKRRFSSIRMTSPFCINHPLPVRQDAVTSSTGKDHVYIY